MSVHKGSQETYDYISKWIHPNFFFSENDQWHRFGMLGVFGDYILSCTQGDIAEIGAGESSIYFTALANKYHRRSYHCDIAASKLLNPMTVKGYLPDDPTYLTPESEHLIYSRGVLFAGPSDLFFRDVKFTPLAIAFIDGDHVYEQAKKDFFNFLPRVVDNGYIFLHDTYPQNENDIDENRCGGVYKLRQEIEKLDEVESITLPHGCAMGVGLTICRKKPKNRAYYNE